MVRFSLVLIDDEKSIRDGISFALKSEFELKTFASAEEALGEIASTPPDLVLLDIGLPGMNGIEALSRIRELYPEMLVIMITAFEDVKTVVSAMKLGAYDYVLKPIVMGALRVTIQNALDSIRLRKEVRLLQENYLKENLPFFIAESNEIREIMEVVTRAAQSRDAPILILGETGTGKELMARAIHYRSPNFKGPFHTLNCAAIPKDLVESELFGYEKGAFSGAEAQGKRGLIEEASEGTLFLDEVGDLSPQAQAKLLRFLENGEFYRVGSTTKRYIRTRVVSATNKNLEAMMEDGSFRRDLYFRLGVVSVHLPSLNERRKDILPLAEHFLVLYSAKYGKKFDRIPKDVGKALEEHHWVGNVRELKNLIERGVLLGKGPELRLEDMGMNVRAGGRNGGSKAPVLDEDPVIPPEGFDLAQAVTEFERRYIRAALKYAEGNESRAARLLRMNNCTFRYQRKKIL
ncbi:MAG TPA: sigma-54 dependent transcriptional regulator [Deltaproteobacteria bacterium]|jgi:DNA-binding NtrC family response regulator|nr:sigma-54 dependent transcriptional regulator [Deltaproteobacteria bacterium]HOI06106.1 sigma-54 dependent transcriptional regulator [Deltaproteobacteria bacterium]